MQTIIPEDLRFFYEHNSAIPSPAWVSGEYGGRFDINLTQSAKIIVYYDASLPCDTPWVWEIRIGEIVFKSMDCSDVQMFQCSESAKKRAILFFFNCCRSLLDQRIREMQMEIATINNAVDILNQVSPDLLSEVSINNLGY